ncbi:hypothetical protein J6590_097300 [Homalodisca vitripennis]|nr:hypothetical protein J6590_097300 [Homalodisca vitripennis]
MVDRNHWCKRLYEMAAKEITDAGKPTRKCEDRLKVLKEIHDIETAGHLGIRNPALKLSQSYNWPGWFRNVQASSDCLRQYVDLHLSAPATRRERHEQRIEEFKKIDQSYHHNLARAFPEAVSILRPQTTRSQPPRWTADMKRQHTLSSAPDAYACEAGASFYEFPKQRNATHRRAFVYTYAEMMSAGDTSSGKTINPQKIRKDLARALRRGKISQADSRAYGVAGDRMSTERVVAVAEKDVILIRELSESD